LCRFIFQNERLLEELQQSRSREQQLETDVQSVRDSGLVSLSNKQAGQIEQLQEQVLYHWNTL